MKLSRMIAVALAAAFVITTAAEAQKEGKAEEKVKFVNQTVCPVMGGAIDSTLYVDMHGQRVYMCCQMCIDAFRKDPDKYFAKAAEKNVLFENVQTACPVSGDPASAVHFVYYKGRGLNFCCNNCVEAFNADPEKYLKKMEAAADEGVEKAKDRKQKRKQED